MNNHGINLGDFQYLQHRQTPAIERVREAAESAKYQCRATLLQPNWDALVPGEPVAMDLEFQNARHESWAKCIHRIGRVSIVNTVGEPVLDVYAAYPREDGVRKFFPPAQFGVNWKDCLFENGAVRAATVERWVKQIVAGRRVLLWCARGDSTAFYLEKDVFGTSEIIDVQLLYSRPGSLLSLRKASCQYLERSIQQTFHSSLEDAQVTLDLWLRKVDYSRPTSQETTENCSEENSPDRDADASSQERGKKDRLGGRRGGRRGGNSSGREFSLMDFVRR